MDDLDIAKFKNDRELLSAAEAGETETVNDLIERGFDVNVKLNNKTPIDLAWEKKNNDVVYVLLKAGSKYPAGFDQKNASENIKIFVKITMDLHDCIRNDN